LDCIISLYTRHHHRSVEMNPVLWDQYTNYLSLQTQSFCFTILTSVFVGRVEVCVWWHSKIQHGRMKCILVWEILRMTWELKILLYESLLTVSSINILWSKKRTSTLSSLVNLSFTQVCNENMQELRHDGS